MTTNQNEILSIDQLSRYLGVPKSTLYRLAAGGGIPGHKVGRHWRFRRQAVDRWLDRPDEQPSQCEGDTK
ncbi:MAG: helix-turn-helix domain-containing protein [Bryobacteraceae bacterium]